MEFESSTTEAWPIEAIGPSVGQCDDFRNQLDKYCILMFDEISIQAHLKPNYASGSVDGFEDFGFKKIGKIANHVQKFS
ncbi:hypothetical protein HUJ04_011923 [Dendroctonus ponderosae]|nr:hypothetical protein HUJ04_011923 [Dendroctonus ponderosae]